MADAVIAAQLDNPDKYTFFVPEDARWSKIRHLKTNVGSQLNKALGALEEANVDALQDVLQHINCNRKVGQRMLDDDTLSNLFRTSGRSRSVPTTQPPPLSRTAAPRKIVEMPKDVPNSTILRARSPLRSGTEHAQVPRVRMQLIEHRGSWQVPPRRSKVSRGRNEEVWHENPLAVSDDETPRVRPWRLRR